MWFTSHPARPCSIRMTLPLLEWTSQSLVAVFSASCPVWGKAEAAGGPMSRNCAALGCKGIASKGGRTIGRTLSCALVSGWMVAIHFFPLYRLVWTCIFGIGWVYLYIIHIRLQVQLWAGSHLSIGGRVAQRQQRLDSAGAAGFEQRYLGAGLHAILDCTCRQPEEKETPERRRPVPCMLGEHVWTPTEMGEDLAMVVGTLSQTLFLRWIQRGAPKTSFKMPKSVLRSAEDGRSCSETMPRRWLGCGVGLTEL